MRVDDEGEHSFCILLGLGFLLSPHIDEIETMNEVKRAHNAERGLKSVSLYVRQFFSLPHARTARVQHKMKRKEKKRVLVLIIIINEWHSISVRQTLLIEINFMCVKCSFVSLCEKPLFNKN